MQRSEQIDELAAALAKAQLQMKPAIKGQANTFFKSKYADLATVAEACMETLNENGLAVIQAPLCNEHGAGVETMLVHSSGQWLAETLVLPVAKNDAQGVGSAITYARRYALAAFAGVCPEDDDGNAAASSVAALRGKTLAVLQKAAKGGRESFAAAWKEEVTKDARQSLTADDLAALKRATEMADAQKAQVAAAREAVPA